MHPKPLIEYRLFPVFQEWNEIQVKVLAFMSELDNLTGNKEGNYMGVSHFLRSVRNILFQFREYVSIKFSESLTWKEMIHHANCCYKTEKLPNMFCDVYM